MNQFWGMPTWKQAQFLGENLPPPLPSTLDWKTFVNQHVTQTPDLEPDKFSIEVYVGGALSAMQCNLEVEVTEPNPNGTSEPFRIESFSHMVDGSPRFQLRWSKPVLGILPPAQYAINPWRQDHMNMVNFHTAPWVRSGVRTIWLDAASENIATDARRWGSLELSRHPRFRHPTVPGAFTTRIGGETFPIITIPGTPSVEIPDDCALVNMRWLANSQVVMQPCAGTTHRELKPYARNLNRATTEVHIVNNQCDFKWVELAHIRRNGHVLSSYWGGSPKQTVEEIKRWYSMGKIKVVDFNGDGNVNQADYDLAFATMNGPIDVQQVKVFASGDLDEDNDIDGADWGFFQIYWADYHGGQTLPPFVDFGGPNNM